jgi:hypothetical protein
VELSNPVDYTSLFPKYFLYVYVHVHLVNVDNNLLPIQLHCCKANDIVTTHCVGSEIMFLKMFQIKVAHLNEVFMYQSFVWWAHFEKTTESLIQASYEVALRSF